MNKINQKEFNANLSKKSVQKNGKTYTNLVLTVALDNGEVVSFEIVEKFYNSKFDFKVKSNIKEVK